jgi:hypothetical protein
MVSRATLIALGVAGVLAALPGPAQAQGFGLGPRLSFVRGDYASATPSRDFLGGVIRMRSSRHVAFEVALDYRTQRSTDGLTRLRERPLQLSLILTPVRGRISPYLLGGFGFYSETVDTLSAAGLVVGSTSDRRTGIHLGAGAEITLSRGATFFADYRFRFVKFGSEAIDQPITIPGLGGVKLSHQGSLWTSGIALYF